MRIKLLMNFDVFARLQVSLLTELRIWDMGYNNVNGTLPSGFGSLTNLQIFVMTKNRLTGSVPADLCLNSSLTDVLLGSNMLTGGFDSSGVCRL